MVCDLAETYHILDFKSLPAKLVGALLYGLPDSSRTKMRLNGTTVPLETIMLAHCSDLLSLMWWVVQRDHGGKPSKPKLLTPTLMGTSTTTKTSGFETGEDFMTWWQSINSKEVE